MDAAKVGFSAHYASAFCLLSNQVRLDIGDNQLTGKLTPWIGYLTSLSKCVQVFIISSLLRGYF